MKQNDRKFVFVIFRVIALPCFLCIQIITLQLHIHSKKMWIRTHTHLSNQIKQTKAMN